MPGCSGVGSRGQYRGLASVPSSTRVHWCRGSLRKRTRRSTEGAAVATGKRQPWAAEGMRGLHGCSSGLTWEGQPSVGLCPGEVKERTEARAKVSATSPRIHWRRHVWDKADTSGERNEERIPSTFRRLRHSNYNKQEIWVLDRSENPGQVSVRLFYGASGQKSDLLREMQTCVGGRLRKDPGVGLSAPSKLKWVFLPRGRTVTGDSQFQSRLSRRTPGWLLNLS